VVARSHSVHPCLTTIYLGGHRLTPVTGSNLSEEKVSWFSRLSSEFEVWGTFPKLNQPSREMDKSRFSGFFLQIFGIFLHFNLGGFSLYVSFSKRTVQTFGIYYESTPQPPGMNTVKRIFRDLRFPRFEISLEKFGERRLFPPFKFDLTAGVTTIYSVGHQSGKRTHSGRCRWSGSGDGVTRQYKGSEIVLYRIKPSVIASPTIYIQTHLWVHKLIYIIP